MLVLSRKKEEKIVVGNITITVVSIRLGSVKLGIDAPKDIPIQREEIRESYSEERKNHGEV
jgi:carbon storage regulator